MRFSPQNGHAEADFPEFFFVQWFPQFAPREPGHRLWMRGTGNRPGGVGNPSPTSDGPLRGPVGPAGTPAGRVGPTAPGAGSVVVSVRARPVRGAEFSD